MRKLIAGTALAALLTAGGTGVALAQGTPGGSTPATPPSTTAAAGPSQNGGIQAPPSTGSSTKHRKTEPPIRRRRPVLRRLLRGSARVAAKTIGITPKELGQELRNGKSVADVAQAHDVDQQTVIDALVKAGDARVATALKDGRLTTKQAERLKKRLSAAATRLVNAKRHVNQPGPLPVPVPSTSVPSSPTTS